MADGLPVTIVGNQITALGRAPVTFLHFEFVRITNAAGGSFKRRVALIHNVLNEVQYDVQLVPQSSGMSCWAASAAAVKQMPMTLKRVIVTEFNRSL